MAYWSSDYLCSCSARGLRFGRITLQSKFLFDLLMKPLDGKKTNGEYLVDHNLPSVYNNPESDGI